MRLSYNWIKDLVEIKLSANKLAEKLTMTGLEVTSLEYKDGDWVFEIEVTSNRPDCLSVVGIAREVAAITNSKFRAYSVERIAYSQSLSAKRYPLNAKTLKIDIENKKDCPLYTARIIKNVKVKPSPEWLTKRLKSIGVRPVNNIVDITNYLLFETGQPLHAFDYDRIGARTICVRRAKKNEKIITIDGVERDLSSEILLICDKFKPIGIAGIMGGKDTEVTAQTKNVILESAYFNPLIIRRGIRFLGLMSESAYRFERGVDIERVEDVSSQATQMLCAITEGQVSSPLYKSGLRQAKSLRKKIIILDVARARMLLGIPINAPCIKKILTSLGLRVLKINRALIKVAIPSFRSDLKQDTDLIEEIARIYGYDKIPLTRPALKSGFQKPISSQKNIENVIKNILVSQGLSEVITYSLIGDKELEMTKTPQDKDIVFVANPLSKEQGILRPQLISGLIKCVAYNLNHQQSDLRLFELGKTFPSSKEEQTLGIIMTGRCCRDWLRRESKLTFFDLKGVLETLFLILGINQYEFVSLEHPLFKKGCGGSILIKGIPSGVLLGEIEGKILSNYDINQEAFFAQVCVERLFPFVNLKRRFLPFSAYPAIYRDISLVLKEGTPSLEAVKIIREIAKSYLDNVQLIDCYQGDQIPEGFKGLTFRVGYRRLDQTLRDEEIDKIQEKITLELEKRLAVKIR